MTQLRTEKEVFTPDEILEAITTYQAGTVTELDTLWQYYIGENPTILKRKKTDANNPDNKLPIPYGRKIVTTYVGYAHRPRFTTYKANIENDLSMDVDEDEVNQEVDEQANPALAMVEKKTPQQLYVDELQKTFNINREHIKSSRNGRNSAIFGVSYEILYIDEVLDGFTPKTDVKFFVVDPRELIVYYDYSSEPKPHIAIRFYKINSALYKVEVYYADQIVTYDRIMESEGKDGGKWKLVQTGAYPNRFNEVPVIAYPFGDDMLGVIRPVTPLIDAMDVLMSDSMNEFDRFSYAYLLMKKFGLTDINKNKSGATPDQNLQNLKKKRVIEHIPEGADVSFLTKDIPTGFIQFMKDALREQIHVQSHVPDFTSDKIAQASGIALQRLLFDFENVCSSVEADFDVGLLERIRLITRIYMIQGRPVGTEDDITISHKRNSPLNMKEFADTAVQLKNAGFSSYLVADSMPDDLVPDVQIELMRQKKEAEELVGMSPTSMGEDFMQEEEPVMVMEGEEEPIE